jgi:uncharacterized lipoprotein YmbA
MNLKVKLPVSISVILLLVGCGTGNTKIESNVLTETDSIKCSPKTDNSVE